ncbi:MAG TPA: 4a-hydroxytetrahydrobiopterin dehydratase [Leptolyngbyaceae cyanobacterium]
MAQLLSETEAQLKLGQLPNWILENKTLKTTRSFRDFIEAINFVNKLVQPAEAAGHHPDICISYNRVTISLTTHDAGGLTDQDFEMAATISGIS